MTDRKTPKVSKKKFIGISNADPNLVKALQDRANSEGRSLAAQIRYALAQYVTRNALFVGMALPFAQDFLRVSGC